MLKSLTEYILQQLNARSPGLSVSDQLTVGLEHEFFLTREGEPCTHEDSQLFLANLSLRRNWRVRERIEDPHFGNVISRVSVDDSLGRFTAIKYDHHPHLLEVAFAYRADVHQLGALVRKILSEIEEIAQSLGLAIDRRCILPVSPKDARVVSPLEAFKNLRHYRSLLINDREDYKEKGYENYAAVIAATQTHIGGTNWWRRPDYLNRLYCFEPELLQLTALAVCGSDSLAAEVIKKRWEGYEAVFSKYPLVGFPRLLSWSVQTWAEALTDSPICGSAETRFASKTLREIASNPFCSWTLFFKEVRDLQIIRPRFFGTLEFRADPSQANAEYILAVVAMRLGLCSYLMDFETEWLDFSRARTSWWKIVEEGKSLDSSGALDFAHLGLKARGFGEEELLSPLKRISEKRIKVPA